MKKVSFLFIVIFAIFSCNSPKDEWVGKKIHISEELQQLVDGRRLSLEGVTERIHGKKKVVSIIDATCVKCIIGQLNRIDSLFRPMVMKNENAEMIFVLNVDEESYPNFMANLYNYIDAQGILLCDSAYQFETENKILTEHIERRTFLLSEDNEILLVGNPLYKKELLDSYKKKLR